MVEFDTWVGKYKAVPLNSPDSLLAAIKTCGIHPTLGASIERVMTPKAQGDIAALATEVTQLKERQKRSDFMLQIIDDPVHKYRGVASSGHSANPSARNFTKIKLEDVCLFCTVKKNMGYAHILPSGYEDEMKKDPVLNARLNRNYSTKYDVRSGRNFIPMCGTHGSKNTCHDLFDSDKFILLPTLTDSVYDVVKLHEDADKLVSQVTLPYMPYKRGLAVRARIAFSKYMSDRSRVSPDFVFQIDFSESSSSRLPDKRKKSRTDVSTTSADASFTPDTSTSADASASRKKSKTDTSTSPDASAVGTGS